MAKYDSLRKLQRDQLLIDFTKQHPELSMEEIGAAFNISRQRVSEILSKARRMEQTLKEVVKS